MLQSYNTGNVHLYYAQNQGNIQLYYAQNQVMLYNINNAGCQSSSRL